MSGDGTVWIPILPQMRGFAASMVEGTGAASKQASAALTAEMGKAGEAAGKAAAAGLGKGVKDVEAASQKLGQARKAEGEAAKQVKAAESELAETRKSGTASSGELAAAEAKVESAHKKASDASAQVTSATKDLTNAKGLLSSASKEVADAAGKVAEAQRKEEDAANKVGVAEAKLADLQAKGTATAGQLEAATAGVEKAKNDLATASDKTAAAQGNLSAAQSTAATEASNLAAENAASRGAMAEAEVGSDSLGLSLLDLGKKAGGAALAFAGIRGIGSIFTGGWDRLTAIDDAEAKLRGLGNSAAEVESIMDSASASVTGTAFGLGEAAGLAGTLVAAGLDPATELQRHLTLVADAAAQSGKGMDQMGDIWAKVAAKGKLDGATMAQMMTAQIPITSMLQDKYSATAEEVQKMVSEGKVSFADFADAMEDKVGGAAQNTGETVSGSMANMKASLNNLGATLLGPVFKKSAGFFQTLTDAVKTVTRNLKPLQEWMAENETVMKVVGGVLTALLVPALVALAIALGTMLWSALVSATTAVWAMNAAFLANPITWIVLGIVALIAVIVLIATKTTWFQTAWEAVWNVVKTVFTAVWNAIKTAFETVWNFIVNNWKTILAILTGPIGIAVGVIVKYWDNIKAAFKAAWDFVKDITAKFVEWLLEKWNEFVTFFTELPGKIAAIASTMWNSVKDAAVTAKDWVVDRFNDVVNFVRELPGKIATAASGMWDGIKNAFKGAINWIIDKWNGLKFTIGGGSFMGVDIPSMTLGVPEIPRFATGGHISGPGSGTSDSILAAVSNGEFVINAKSTAQHLPLIEAINSGTLPAFRKGGMVEAQSFARGESGKPYQYGGVGNPSWDCSGYMSGIYATITGKNPKTRHFTTESDFDALGFKKGRGGKNDFSIGVKRGGGGRNSHMAGTLGDLNVESGGNGVIAGSGAQGADDFPLQWYYPMAGDDPDASVSGLGAGMDLAGGTSGASGGGGSGSSSYTDGDGTKVWVTNWPTGSSTTSTTSSGGGNGGSTTTSVSSGEVMGDNPNAVDYGIWGSDPEAGVVDALLEIFELNDVLSAEQLIGTRESRYGVGGAAAGTPIGGGVEDGTSGPSTVGMVVHGDVITQDTDELLEKQEASLRAAQAAGGL